MILTLMNKIDFVDIYNEDDIYSKYLEIYDDDSEVGSIPNLVEYCPECGSPDTDRDDEGYLICNNCLYQEGENLTECIVCGKSVPVEITYEGLCPECQAVAEL